MNLVQSRHFEDKKPTDAFRPFDLQCSLGPAFSQVAVSHESLLVKRPARSPSVAQCGLDNDYHQLGVWLGADPYLYLYLPALG